MHDQPSDTNTWADTLKETDFLAKYGSKCLYAILGMILVIALVNRYVTTSDAKAEKDYLDASTELSKLSINQDNAEQHLKELQEILHRRHELHSKYDGILAQELLNRGDVTAAAGYAHLNLERTQTSFNELYGKYTGTTLAIAEKRFGDALTEAKNLKKALEDQGIEKKEDFGSILYAYNLLRIAFLQQELGMKEQEVITWHAFKDSAQWNSPALGIPAAYKTVLKNFSVGEISLQDYVEERLQSQG